jgi:diketogulonate reductase-like aldo/keto reductase
MEVVENKGARIPVLGLGTMRLKEETCVRIVSTALQQGYRHIDTAQMYGNEREVGEGLKASSIPREQIFVTTKVWWDKFAPVDLENSVEESLKKLDLRYVDLLLLHWPNPKVPYVDTLNSLAKVKRAGLTKHVGVANNTVALLAEAVKLSPEPLVNNQIEVHPMLDANKILAACAQHDVSVTAYCPIGRGKLDNPTLDRIGAAHGKSGAQVSLRWLVQQGMIVIPGTSKEERLKENAAIFDFTLTDAEMAEISKLAQPDGRIVSPPFAPKWDV